MDAAQIGLIAAQIVAAMPSTNPMATERSVIIEATGETVRITIEEYTYDSDALKAEQEGTEQDGGCDAGYEDDCPVAVLPDAPEPLRSTRFKIIR